LGGCANEAQATILNYIIFKILVNPPPNFWWGAFSSSPAQISSRFIAGKQIFNGWARKKGGR